ncbi:MAG: acetolactate synthase small subunit [Rickettsiales bacterium]|nr:acetolactate synthase small subunit [Rickettsiales bacterium]|tara:strand:- start:67 stop:579 length:513 start_codon:yes stop_codon:yes gene_type:complete
MNKSSQKHIISIMVDNEPGVLARVVGLFSGRGYNIESLSVSEVDSDKFLSRVTIVTSGTKIIVDQIKSQLLKLIPVHNLIDLTEEKSFVAKELILIKLSGKKKMRKKTFDIANKFNASILFDSNNELIFEMIGTTLEISKFISKVRPMGIIELTRSGTVSMSFNSDYIKK